MSNKNDRIFNHSKVVWVSEQFLMGYFISKLKKGGAYGKQSKKGRLSKSTILNGLFYK